MGWLFNIEVGAGDALYATIPFLGQRMDFQPLGGSRFRVLGGVLDDNTALFEGDRLFAGIAEARRIRGWQSARALVLYAGIAALLVIAALTFVALRRNVAAKAGIHWSRVLTGGLLAEVTTFAIAVPVFLLFGEPFIDYFVIPDSFVVAFAVGFAVARRAGSRFVLHGALVGGVATIVHFAVVMAQPEPFPYLVAHVMKILGGAAGGHIAQRRESQ
jgi:putative membrane protein (TIGR04086 family)